MEASDRSRVSSLANINTTISHVELLIGNVAENVHIFSDGMPSKFDSRFMFHFLTKIQLEKNIVWHDNERGYGKVPMDIVVGTVKNLVFKKLKSVHCIIDTVFPICQQNLWIHYFIINDYRSFIRRTRKC